MTITKANAKENLGEFSCLSITKAKAKQNLQIFICNLFRADGHHWTDNYYIASRYFSDIDTFDVICASIMVCESILRRCNSGRCMPAQRLEHQKYITSIAWN